MKKTMKILAVSILALVLWSCGESKENQDKKAKKIGLEYGEKYCDCISKINENESTINCYEEVTIAMEKQFKTEGFDEETGNIGIKSFKLAQQACEAK